jgi:hypothetical protein
MTCDHLYAVYYDRPWWRLFRKRIVLACWRCDQTWPEPTGLTRRYPDAEAVA